MDVTFAPAAERPAGALSRRDPAVRAVALAWRRLTGGGAPTLVACSGGADSTALALALHAAGAPVAVAHVVHDMRPRADALHDRDAARALALRLGAPFVETEVAVAGGNVESVARRRRYVALARLARERRLRWVATAHHADDQFESMIMALIRGAGPAGLRGVAPSRRLTAGVTLIRPMLRMTRADTERLCRDAGVVWATDRTNADTTRLRTALRAGPLPEIARIRPGAASRAAGAAELLHDAAAIVEDRVRAVFGEADSWGRAALRAERPLVVGAGLRRAALRLTGGVGADRLGTRRVAPAVAAVRDASTEPRRFEWPGGVVVLVLARRVTVARA